ncbi:hypothetical protein HYT84_01210 [Candidatus Micrarchaeota archaeon]|nr:hypothetical protein [Candidatus Micrarchaeota archaeon]
MRLGVALLPILVSSSIAAKPPDQVEAKWRFGRCLANEAALVYRYEREGESLARVVTYNLPEKPIGVFCSSKRTKIVTSSALLVGDGALEMYYSQAMGDIFVEGNIYSFNIPPGFSKFHLSDDNSFFLYPNGLLLRVFETGLLSNPDANGQEFRLRIKKKQTSRTKIIVNDHSAVIVLVGTSKYYIVNFEEGSVHQLRFRHRFDSSTKFEESEGRWKVTKYGRTIGHIGNDFDL